MAGDDASGAAADAVSSTANPSKADDPNLLDYDPDSPFQCCVCLDLLYKPVVLACGHISCFWCVHHAMHSLQTSHCAICRQPYRHFPSICLLLHYLILKLEPVACKRREKEVLNEERRRDVFSPNLPEHLLQKNVSCGENWMHFFLTMFFHLRLFFHRNTVIPISLGHLTSPEDGLEKPASNGVSISDVLCSCCKEMLYQPVVLNCGHAYCKSCLSETTETIKCLVCQSLHPGGFPNVCLDLDHFLEEQFSREYESRKQNILLEKLKGQHADPSSSALVDPSKTDREVKTKSSESTDGCSQQNEDLSDVHIGVGCDSCGMYPIIGKRYKCKDCKEIIGFDLCEACYNTTSKLPGRFNQQHTPDHKFELHESRLWGRTFWLRALADNLQQYIVVPEDFLPLDDAEEHDDHNAELEDVDEEDHGE